mmetsp:Transcript_30797/g.70633  ORF Transcript_30797/g.70633 Transcript_30797/m.70633 type:complete len:404 (-) Transcript_30797:137-1348(-)
MCTTSLSAYNFALGLCSDYEEKLRKKEAKAPRRPELKQKSKSKDTVDAGPSRKVTDIDYEKHEDTIKELELQEKQEVFARKQLEAANRPANMGCSHDHQKEWAIYEKPFEEKIAGADRFRLEGNEAYNKQNYGLAAVHYRKALLQFDYTIPETPEEERQVDEVKTKCLLNLAACKCQQEEWDEVLTQCRLALEIDPRSVKAYYRRGQAYLARDNFELAKDSLLSAYDIEPKDPAVLELLRKLKQKMALYKTRTKEVYTTMVNQTAAADASPAESVEHPTADAAEEHAEVARNADGTAQQAIEEVESTDEAIANASQAMIPPPVDQSCDTSKSEGGETVEAEKEELAATAGQEEDEQDLDGHEAVMQLVRDAVGEKVVRWILPTFGVAMLIAIWVLLNQGGQDL